MPTYAIGDVQGCYAELQQLLELIAFSPEKDTLWFAGDLVNRGPQSLEVLRFIQSLKNTVVVFGNHDVHLLSLLNGHSYSDHTLHDILTAPDRHEIEDWLRHQPFLHYDPELGYAMAHAGIFPQWNIEQALLYSAELEALFRVSDYKKHLQQIEEGDEPDQWDSDLAGYDRYRFMLNAFTRMRFCTAEGKLEFSYSGKIGSQPVGYIPWFEMPHRANQNTRIIFGHWAALEGNTSMGKNVFGLDTGCVWGKALTAMRLDDGQIFSQYCN